MTILQERELKGIEQGVKQGIEQGIEQGREQEIKNIVKKGIEKGYDIKMIMDMTDLTRDKLEEIKREVLD